MLRLNILDQLSTSLKRTLRIDATINRRNSSTTVRAASANRIRQDMNRLYDSSEIKNRAKLMTRFSSMFKDIWEGVDSNHRSPLRDEIYSLTPSATRTPAQMSYLHNSSNIKHSQPYSKRRLRRERAP